MQRDVQKRSPAPAASPFFSCRSSTVHSHSGYSSSAIATGSSRSLRKLRPLRGVPAGTELRTSGDGFFSAAAAAAAASFFNAAGGEGVIFSLKDCAAEVEVAAGGLEGEPGAPFRAAVCVAVVAEMGVAFWRVGLVENGRAVRAEESDGMGEREERRRQRLQIILGGEWRSMAMWLGWAVGCLSKVQMARRKGFSAPLVCMDTAACERVSFTACSHSHTDVHQRAKVQSMVKSAEHRDISRVRRLWTRYV